MSNVADFRLPQGPKSGRMTFLFTPPLQLAGTPAVSIRSLEDAADFLGGYAGRWPMTRDLMLRRL